MNSALPWSSTVSSVLAVLLLLPLAACSEEREYPEGGQCFAWEQDIGPLLEERCVECHTGEDAGGSYRLTSYLATLATGSDEEPNAIAGDESSLLLTTLAAGTADDVHDDFTEDVLPTLRTWVVDCDLAFTDSPIHEPGILNPRSEDFHGHLLRDIAYDFEQCAECHGEDFAGGTADASCITCHDNGVTDCTTCHSSLPSRGAHAAHLPDTLEFGASCESCHSVPTEWDAVGHVFLEDGSLDPPPVEVMLSGKAAEDGPSMAREGPPQYDPETASCDNVYCHGDTFADANAAITMPVWTGGIDQAACGTCHGLPPENHGMGLDECHLCHGEVVDADLNIIAPELHVDTMLQVVEGDQCTLCHGMGDDPAPPFDLSGNTSEALVTVGAHQAHLGPPFRLGAPVECGACHLVPTEVGDEGHLDGELPAEVFPAEIADSSLAFAQGASPVWDRDAETCSDVYCHGGGTELADDTTPTLNRTPTWTASFVDEVYCGSCHGIPPNTDTHLGFVTLDECHLCHTGTVDEFGNIIFEGPPDAPTSLHMDGDIDFRDPG